MLPIRAMHFYFSRAYTRLRIFFYGAFWWCPSGNSSWYRQGGWWADLFPNIPISSTPRRMPDATERASVPNSPIAPMATRPKTTSLPAPTAYKSASAGSVNSSPASRDSQDKRQRHTAGYPASRASAGSSMPASSKWVASPEPLLNMVRLPLRLSSGFLEEQEHIQKPP